MANNNINIPQNEFLNPETGRPSQPWLMWLMNPSVLNITLNTALSVISGGTGIVTAPTDGQLLIGNNGAYNLNTLTQGTGILIGNGAGSVSITNDGVTTLSAGSGISLSANKGDITVTNNGVTSLLAGSGISLSSNKGDITISSNAVTSFSAGTTGLSPSTASTGNILLSGVLNVANGGTGLNNLPAKLIPYGNGTSAFLYNSEFYFDNIGSSDKILWVNSASSNVRRSIKIASATSFMAMGIDSSNLSYLYADSTMLFITATVEQLRILNTGAISFGSTGTNYGSSGNILTSGGGGGAPIWVAGVSGAFTSADIPPQTITVTNGIITSIV
jgi:hypothetical protein